MAEKVHPGLLGPDGKPFPRTSIAPAVGEHRSAQMVGTFTLPTDFPSAKLHDLDFMNRSFVRPWVDRLTSQGWTLRSNVIIEREDIPEVGDIYKGLTDTLRYRYNMKAMFSRPAETLTFENIPDTVANKLPARYKVEK